MSNVKSKLTRVIDKLYQVKTSGTCGHVESLMNHVRSRVMALACRFKHVSAPIRWASVRAAEGGADPHRPKSCRPPRPPCPPRPLRLSPPARGAPCTGGTRGWTRSGTTAETEGIDPVAGDPTEMKRKEIVK